MAVATVAANAAVLALNPTPVNTAVKIGVNIGS